MRNKIKISASILAANPMRFEEEIKRIEAAGIDLIHIDVMDGHFVPNITIGPFIVAGIRRITNIPLDIHLMIEHPERYVEAFAGAAEGNGIITFHIETVKNPKEIISLIKSTGMKVGISLNPGTPVEMIENFLDQVDMALVMSVNPGFAGQKFIPIALPKIARLRDKAPDKMDIQVDGGITPDNISQVVKQGANVIVAASAIFKTSDPGNAIKSLKQIAEQTMEKDAVNLVIR
ncbi:MAG: ribulose-phosphate 3-epimerase [Candidatus Kuenenia stuttgartiensis]|nr:ribulose-phosphate 3-epimerase [Candidatus Kuenenia stuttgartiensis]